MEGHEFANHKTLGDDGGGMNNQKKRTGHRRKPKRVVLPRIKTTKKDKENRAAVSPSSSGCSRDNTRFRVMLLASGGHFSGCVFDGNSIVAHKTFHRCSQARDYLEKPEEMTSVVDPSLKHFREKDLKVICEVVSICIHLRPRDQVSMQDLCAILEIKIDTSVSSELRASSLAWAELALSS